MEQKTSPRLRELSSQPDGNHATRETFFAGLTIVLLAAGLKGRFPLVSGPPALDGSDLGSESQGGNGGLLLAPASSLGSVGGRWGDNDATTEDDCESNCNNAAAAETSYFNTSSHLQVRSKLVLRRFLNFENRV